MAPLPSHPKQSINVKKSKNKTCPFDGPQYPLYEVNSVACLITNVADGKITNPDTIDTMEAVYLCTNCGFEARFRKLEIFEVQYTPEEQVTPGVKSIE